MKLMSLNKIKKKNKGFTLLELILVLGIGSMAFVGFIQMEQKRQENLSSENAGGQLYEVGQALAQYINLNNSVLQTAVPPGNVTTITLAVMQASGTTTPINGINVPNRNLLPSTYINRLGFPTVTPINYTLYLRNNAGTIVGLVLTDAALRDKSGAIRYDWGGIAMKKAGSNAGITFTSATQLNGLNGAWALNATTDFPAINALGKIGYRVAYQGTFDSTYLRLDGLYPMNGHLNMGNYNIRNATDISYTGWLYGNNGVMNNLLTGTITNAGNITTQSINGKQTLSGTINSLSATNAGNYANTYAAGASYANFDVLYSNCINCGVPGDVGPASIKYNANAGDVKIGNSGNAGTLFVKDIILSNPGSTSGSGRNSYLSDRLPRYADRGIQVVDNGGGVAMPMITSTPTNPNYGNQYTCRWTGEGRKPVAKIEVIPALQWVQGAVLGTQQLSFAGSYINSANQLILNGSIYQDQYSLGAFQTYATVVNPNVDEVWSSGLWRITAQTPAYDPANIGGKVLAHVYCDYGA